MLRLSLQNSVKCTQYAISSVRQIPVVLLEEDTQQISHHIHNNYKAQHSLAAERMLVCCRMLCPWLKRI